MSFCNGCGTQLEANAAFCSKCGKTSGASVPNNANAAPPQQPYPPYGYNPHGYYPPVQQPGHGLAVGSMVLGIVSLIFSWFPYLIPLSIVGTVLAVVAMKQGNKGGMAIAGLICSLIALIISAIVLIVIISTINRFTNPSFWW